MDYTTALTKAAALCDHLKDHCQRIIIAGSIRRLKGTDIKDIELVCIPNQEGDGLFADIPRHSLAWGNAVLAMGTVTSGDLIKGKHIKLNLRCGTKVDLYTTTATNWGWRLLLSTGSSEHNIRMVQALHHNGYRTEGGHILWKGVARVVTTEQEVFRMAGMKYVDPQFRV